MIYSKNCGNIQKVFTNASPIFENAGSTVKAGSSIAIENGCRKGGEPFCTYIKDTAKPILLEGDI